MLTKQKKSNIVSKFKKTDSDTGSLQVQIALLSRRIKELTGHLKTHKKDIHSRKGLIGLVAQRRNHMKYLKKNNIASYEKVVVDLKLKPIN